MVRYLFPVIRIPFPSGFAALKNFSARIPEGFGFQAGEKPGEL
jgi:hypothetical protein